MILEPTSLAATARVVGETLEQEYGVDPEAVFERAGLDMGHLDIPGARYSFRGMQALWRESVAATQDECFGAMTGQRVRATSFNAVGFAFLASESLVDGLRRLVRYHEVITTVPLSVKIEQFKNRYEMYIEYTDPDQAPEVSSIDAFVTSILQLCRAASDKEFAPRSVVFERKRRSSLERYEDIFGCPVSSGGDRITISFDREILERSLPGNNIELARANDKIADRYLASLEPRSIASEVREHLVKTLPSGDTSQKLIAIKMNRSLSTLQRQLNLEGTSFRSIQDETRRTLAKQYVTNNELSLSQIAYMLGFSDQSNFSRAFRRWFGSTPGKSREISAQ